MEKRSAGEGWVDGVNAQRSRDEMLTLPCKYHIETQSTRKQCMHRYGQASSLPSSHTIVGLYAYTYYSTSIVGIADSRL